jgi:hypothetical protein
MKRVNGVVLSRDYSPRFQQRLAPPTVRGGSMAPTMTDPPALGVDAQGHHTTNRREQNIG